MQDELIATLTELLQRLEEVDALYRAAGLHADVDSYATALARKALQQAQAECWISIDERLPDDDECVLIWPPADEFSDAPSIAWYCSDRDDESPPWATTDVFDEPNPTHWRPLPAPPKKAEAPNAE